MTNFDEVKACCATAYSSDAVALLLGESYHPGGATLTRRLARLMSLNPGQRVADIAAGAGATSLLLATEYGVSIEGVDFAVPSVGRAREAANRQGLAHAVSFHVADAECIPLPDSAFDAVITECAFCTFPDKSTAAAEIARILRPGGHLGLADVTVAEDGLPAELTTLAAWVACVADARPVDQYCQILADAGLRVVHTERHDSSLVRMLDQIEARIQLLRMTKTDLLARAGIDVTAVVDFIATARRALRDGLLGYALIVAGKPGPGADDGPRRPAESIKAP